MVETANMMETVKKIKRLLTEVQKEEAKKLRIKSAINRRNEKVCDLMSELSYYATCLSIDATCRKVQS